MVYSADLILPVTSEPIKEGSVCVENGRISAFGPRAEIIERFKSDDEHYFKNSIIMPGLVNLHGHIECSCFDRLAKPANFSEWLGEIIKASSNYQREDWLSASREGVKRYLQSGITCTADITRSGTGIQALMEAGMPAVVFIEAVAIDRNNIALSVIDILERIKSTQNMIGDGWLKVGLSPHSPYTLSTQALKACGQIAQEYELPITIHVAETKGEIDLIQTGAGSLAERIGARLEIEAIETAGTGKTVIEFLDEQGLLNNDTIAAHGVWLNRKDIETLKERNAIIALCPTSNEILNSGVAPIGMFAEAGLRFGFGTDSPASNPEMDLFLEARKALKILTDAGDTTGHTEKLDPKKFVEKLTIEAASMLSLDEHVGSIDDGKRADLVVIDYPETDRDPYEYILDSAEKILIQKTILSGNIAYDRG
jgi:5-methylthioadenosine/S-adenosylhomocysteine deaminase